MPRLDNKKAELYCYARVYHNMPKIRAVEFAGYRPFAMNYKRLEDKPEVQARLVEMRKTPKEEIYAEDGPPQPSFAENQDSGLKEHYEQAVSLLWMLEQLKINMEQAREAGKYNHANEAIKMMAGIMQLQQKEADQDFVSARARELGIMLDDPRKGTKTVPQELKGPDAVGSGDRDGAETEALVEIRAPGDAPEPDEHD